MNIIIGGMDRAGTTLLATFFKSVNDNYTVLYETPFKFLYLDSDIRVFAINAFIKERFNQKYYKEFGFTDLPSIKETLNIICNKNIIDHTPKNMWYYKGFKDIYGNNFIMVLAKRNIKSLYLSHKRLDWGIKNPIKFSLWYCLLNRHMMKLASKYDNVYISEYEELIKSDVDYLNNLIQETDITIKGREEIPLAKYTLKQHTLVNSPKLDTSKIDISKDTTTFFENVIFNSYYLFEFIIIILHRILIKNKQS